MNEEYTPYPTSLSSLIGALVKSGRCLSITHFYGAFLSITHSFTSFWIIREARNQNQGVLVYSNDSQRAQTTHERKTVLKKKTLCYELN